MFCCLSKLHPESIQSYEVLGFHLRYQIIFQLVRKMNHTISPSYSNTHYMLPYAYEHTPLCASDCLVQVNSLILQFLSECQLRLISHVFWWHYVSYNFMMEGVLTHNNALVRFSAALCSAPVFNTQNLITRFYIVLGCKAGCN